MPPTAAAPPLRPPQSSFLISTAADEVAAELARHGIHGTRRVERHLGGMVFVGAARNI